MGVSLYYEPFEPSEQDELGMNQMNQKKNKCVVWFVHGQLCWLILGQQFGTNAVQIWHLAHIFTVRNMFQLSSISFPVICDTSDEKYCHCWSAIQGTQLLNPK